MSRLRERCSGGLLAPVRPRHDVGYLEDVPGLSHRRRSASGGTSPRVTMRVRRPAAFALNRRHRGVREHRRHIWEQVTAPPEETFLAHGIFSIFRNAGTDRKGRHGPPGVKAVNARSILPKGAKGKFARSGTLVSFRGFIFAPCSVRGRGPAGRNAFAVRFRTGSRPPSGRPPRSRSG